MAKLNSKAKPRTASRYTTKATVNHEGSSAYQLNDEARLVTGVMTCFFKEPKYYGDTSDEIVQAARRLIQVNPEFVAKTAVFARKEFHMRTISQVLAAEVAKHAKGHPIVRKMTKAVIERPDDITNLLSYYFTAFGKRKDGNSITRSLRRGIADVFPRFDEYQLGKYKGSKDEVKLRDALLIARPKPNDDAQAALWKRLINNELETPETRETILSEKGQSKEVWEEMISKKTLGYMALLRNLKNMLDNKVSPEHMKIVLDYLRDPAAVRKSKQLPFRFYSAYKMVERECKGVGVSKVLEALEEALTVSFENLPQLKGVTAIITDESGSMQSPISKDSFIQMIDIGNLLGAAANKFCEEAIMIPFGTYAKIVNMSPKSSIFDNMQKLESSGVGCGTDPGKALELIDGLGQKVDRIILLSDMQCYEDRYGRNSVQQWLDKYRSKTNKEVWIHSIDLQGYGTSKVLFEKKANLIAGWSEKVLEYVSLMEESGKDLIDKIRNYPL